MRFAEPLKISGWGEPHPWFDPPTRHRTSRRAKTATYSQTGEYKFQSDVTG